MSDMLKALEDIAQTAESWALKAEVNKLSKVAYRGYKFIARQAREAIGRELREAARRPKPKTRPEVYSTVICTKCHEEMNPQGGCACNGYTHG